MRFALTSDLHIDINEKRKNKEFTNELLAYLSTLSIEGLIVTGDVSSRNADLRKFFKSSSNLSLEAKIFVPGNHDIWVNRRSESLSWYQMNSFLPKLLSNNEWYYLPNNPLIIDRMLFVGTMGWYDYSFRNPIWDDTITTNDYIQKINPLNKLRWMDSVYAKFGEYSDHNLVEYFINQLQSDLDISQGNTIDTLVVCSHFVPFKECITYRGILEYDYFAAFLGSEQLGRFIKSKQDQYKWIYSIFGHMHSPTRKQISDISAHCVPIGYPREYGESDLITIFEQRIVEINLR